MIKNYFLFILPFFLMLAGAATAQQKSYWSETDVSNISPGDLIKPSLGTPFRLFDLELENLAEELSVLHSTKAVTGDSDIFIDFPDSHGNLESFAIEEMVIMEPELSRKFPNNRSYKGVSVRDRGNKIYFSVNELGVHAIVLSENRTIQYIEPASKDLKRYKVFKRNDVHLSSEFTCLTDDSESSFSKVEAYKLGDDGKLRTYRLALAGTGEYASYHISQQGMENAAEQEKKAVVLAAMATAITRVNALFENDLAIRLQLVANNDELIYLDPDTDPYSNFDASLITRQNQTNCDRVIQSANYDIGHVFSTGLSSAVDELGIVCKNEWKARGTTGSPSPDGDIFYYDFVAHEFGHQFGANHTFNGDKELCGINNQRNPQTAVEPGSGSTIMAYAGLCAPQNVQFRSDLYFHTVSIQEIREFVTQGAGNSCAVTTDLEFNQYAPVVNAGEDRIIPKGTPFKLTGEASDEDKDELTFAWEQTDNGITIVPPSPFATSGALNRSVKPSISSSRYVPSLNTLINGSTSSKWEVIPETARDLNFTLTVRDNNREAGRVGSDDLVITVSDDAGPFRVTSQDMDVTSWVPGTQETISWDVAGSDSNGIDVSQVNILLSVDGGISFTEVLAANVPNDGNQVISVPEIRAPNCFVMVEAVGNIFFSISARSFSIGDFNKTCNTYFAADTPLTIPDNDPKGVSSSITVTEDISIERIDVRLIEQINNSLTGPGIDHSYLGDLTVSLQSPQGTTVDLIREICGSGQDIEATFSDAGDALECNSFNPGISGVKKAIEDLSAFNGENARGIWTLTVTDAQDEDVGSLQAWGLEICGFDEVLASKTYAFEEFKVFPNPSNGVFNLRFRSEEIGDVRVELYDLLGRTIADFNFRSKSIDFEEQLDLSQISRGTYILRVRKGRKIDSRMIQLK
jgi:subtilisin-like proprotein convertase family protein